jgi:NAD(P)-dependent dehydrogenase (short-subunit alcohol dehydrogenase family)
MQFVDRTVIVTGGGSGIGQAMALRFAAERAAVVIADRNGGRAMEVAREITAAGGRAIATQTDVSVSPEVQAMVALAGKSFGAVDVLVNNAAAPGGDNLASMDEATWDRDLTVCLKSAFLCCRYVLPGMIERKRGVIVNIASVNALGYFGNEAYSAAKAGVISLTESLAARYGRYGIRANAIAPGSIRTPIWQHRIEKDPEVLKRLEKWYPLGRIGEPADVANAALFLASDAASWISGVVLRVDGGLMAGNPLMADDLLVESRQRPSSAQVSLGKKGKGRRPRGLS